MYVDIDQHLRDLDDRPLGGSEAVNVRIAIHSFPDLRAYRDHLGVVRLCTPHANGLCDSIHILHRTDVDGSTLEIMPFFLDKQVHIYADPPLYVVGQRNPNGFGESPLPDWQELLEDAGLSKAVISKVRQYLKQHPPISYRDVPD